MKVVRLVRAWWARRFGVLPAPTATFHEELNVLCGKVMAFGSIAAILGNHEKYAVFFSNNCLDIH